MILKIKNDLWDFFLETRKTLFKIDDWTVYRSATKLMKENKEKNEGDDFLSLFYRVNQLSDLGRHDDAIAEYDRALAIKPTILVQCTTRSVCIL